ncbi:MAG: sulfatase-like hydrolase/transferase [Planctomycetales bacterium]|nr:sulfatase-like hydrolase/transferase [Planctomycetales bacterium]
MTTLLNPLPAANAQSNVVVIISDDAGWADYGFMRNIDSAADPGNRGAVPTPNLDALAAQGVAFTNAYTGAVCSPSRAMIVTGQYGTRFGYGSNIQSSTTAINNASTVQGLPTEITTVWERMQGAGYATAAVGKWHLGEHADGGGQLGNRPENQGIEFFQGLWEGSRSYTVGSTTGAGALRETISDGAGGVTSNVVIEGNYSGQYVTDVFGNQSADYIRNNAGGAEPFFLYTSFTAPHTPLQATAADLAYIDSLGEPGFTGTRRTYAAMQYAMDRNVGKVMAALADPAGDGVGPGKDADSILDDTLVIFINDNGGDCCDGDPNASDNGDLRNGKGSQFEGGLRVPMIIAGAGVNSAARGTVSTDLVHSIDIVPTALLGAAGGSFGANDVIDGVNLLPYVNGTAAGVPHENLFIPRFNNQQSAVRRGPWKYMYQNGTGYQLYNLDDDIDESNNVVDAPANAAVVEELHQLLASYHVQLDKPRHDNQAPETNQFDHFQFREAAFTAATFTSADAWTNGDTGTGSYTASWRDGYADNQLTFRTKPSGDYVVTNNLTSVGGFAYMTNTINFTSQPAALAAPHSGTINGDALLLVKNRKGDGPEINLDATDAAPGLFTFNLDADVEVYDDLTIQGDGNQEFRINGRIREFRPERNVVKSGNSTAWIGGGTDLTGNLTVQGGTVEFASATVKANNVIAQAGTTIRVGGGGFGESQITVTPGPQPVTSHLALEYDAAADGSGDAVWNATARSEQIGLDFGGAASAISVIDPTLQRLTAAYSTGTVGGASSPSSSNTYFEAGSPTRSRSDATFEVVFRVNDVSAGDNQVLLDVGATRGVSLVLDGAQLEAGVDGDAGTLLQTATLTPGWHQAVVVIDLDGSSAPKDSWSLYLDNSLVSTQTGVVIGDWAGGNAWGIGQESGGALDPTGSTATVAGAQAFQGDVALWRYYHNLAFSAADVTQNYQSLLAGDTATVETVASVLNIDGNFLMQANATLELDLRDPATHDSVVATGLATLGGNLVVSAESGFAPAVGDSYDLLFASAGVSGRFDSIALPDAGQFEWLVEYEANAVNATLILGADFNDDGAVNGADFLIWQRGLGQTGQTSNANGDADGNGVVDQNDLRIWSSQYGTTPVAGVTTLGAVPEPSSRLVALCGGVALLVCKGAGIAAGL